jgi:hypothetical protein
MKIRTKKHNNLNFYNLTDVLNYLELEGKITETEKYNLEKKFIQFLGKEMSKNIISFLFYGNEELYFQQFYFYRVISFLNAKKRHEIVNMEIYGMAQHPDKSVYKNIFTYV